MASEVKTILLRDCLEYIIDNRGKTPPTSKAITPYQLIEVNAIAGSNKSPNYNIIKKYVDEKTYNTWFRTGHPKKGDILFSTVGSIAEVAILNKDNVCIAQNLIGLRPNAEIVNPDYLYYFLIAPTTQAQLRSLDISSVQPSIKVPHLLSIRVPILSLKKQKIIAEFLNSLDARINLISEINSTLESIAQTLFKSWFVDFDPVRAKAEGRVPEGIDAETAALFPDSFEESELGLMPKGWRNGKVADILELNYGKALKATDRVFGTVPVYGSGGITGYHNEPLVKETSIIVGRKGTVGSLYWEDDAFFPIDTVFYVKTKVALTYCFYMLKTLGLGKMNTDAAVPGLNRNNVYRLPIIIGSDKLIYSFDEIVKQLRQKIFINIKLAKTLTDIRDMLLPHLISGQLRLPEVKAIMEKAL